MTENTIDANVTISRPSRGEGDVITIQITDELSRIRFVTVELTAHDFTMAITGLSHIRAKAKVVGLEHVGQRKIIESRRVVCPHTTYDKEKLRAWMVENCQEPGWTMDTYLGSQGSISTDPETGHTVLRYSVTRYEPITPTPTERTS